MKRLTMALLVLVSILMLALPGSARMDSTGARDSSIIPSAEINLTLLTISDDNDHPVTLPTTINTVAVSPLILMVRSDGSFLEGDAVPDQANDLYRDANVIYSLPVAARTTWHFKRATGAGTVNIRMKLYAG